MKLWNYCFELIESLLFLRMSGFPRGMETPTILGKYRVRWLGSWFKQSKMRTLHRNQRQWLCLILSTQDPTGMKPVVLGQQRKNWSFFLIVLATIKMWTNVCSRGLGRHIYRRYGYYSPEFNHNDNHMIWTDQQEEANVWQKMHIDLCVSVHMGI